VDASVGVGKYCYVVSTRRRATGRPRGEEGRGHSAIICMCIFVYHCFYLVYYRNCVSQGLLYELLPSLACPVRQCVSLFLSFYTAFLWTNNSLTLDEFPCNFVSAMVLKEKLERCPNQRPKILMICSFVYTYTHTASILLTDGQTDGNGKTISRRSCYACWRAI